MSATPMGLPPVPAPDDPSLRSPGPTNKRLSPPAPGSLWQRRGVGRTHHLWTGVRALPSLGAASLPLRPGPSTPACLSHAVTPPASGPQASPLAQASQCHPRERGFSKCKAHPAPGLPAVFPEGGAGSWQLPLLRAGGCSSPPHTHTVHRSKTDLGSLVPGEAPPPRPQAPCPQGAGGAAVEELPARIASPLLLLQGAQRPGLASSS